MQRVSPGALILGIFAILFGLVGAYAAKKYLKAGESPAAVAEARPRMISVPVAVRDMPAGRTVAEGDVMSLSVSPQDLAKLKLPPAWMEKTSQIIGRTLKEPVKQRSAFDPALFYPTGIGPSVADRLQPGERAVSIPYDGKAAEAALVTPGAMVDVLFRTAVQGQKGLDATVTLLSKVRVLAVGQTTQEGATAAGAANVTLAVNQTQARALKVVEDKGSLLLVLRHTKDESVAEKAAPTTLPELLGFKAPEPPITTQIYRRGQLTTTTFADGQVQSIVSEPPYGLPVVGQTPAAEPAPERTTSARPAPAVATAEPAKLVGRAGAPVAGQRPKTRPAPRSL